MDDPSPEAAWFRAFRKLYPKLLPHIDKEAFCEHIRATENEIAERMKGSMLAKDWNEVERIANELRELGKLKDLVCRR